jgi:cytidylate kinase
MRRFQGLTPLIVVDGPAASGKSTLARRLAEILGLPFISTGAMYRAVTLAAMRRRVRMTDKRALVRIARGLRLKFTGGKWPAPMKIMCEGRDISKEIEAPEISRNTSTYIANVPEVRVAIVEATRKHLTARGLVAEGRDCGSVIFPDAPWKFFMSSSFQSRAHRRYRDLRKAGHRVSLRSLLDDMERRDREDRTRPRGALLAMPDAWMVDNSNLEQAETLGLMLRRIDPDAVV